jgi:hypothetical protein
MYSVHLSPTTFPHVKHRTGMICRDKSQVDRPTWSSFRSTCHYGGSQVADQTPPLIQSRREAVALSSVPNTYPSTYPRQIFSIFDTISNERDLFYWSAAFNQRNKTYQLGEADKLDVNGWTNAPRNSKIQSGEAIDSSREGAMTRV